MEKEIVISARQLRELLENNPDQLIQYLKHQLMGRSHVFGNFTIKVITEHKTSQVF